MTPQKIKEVTSEGKSLRLHIWDTAGQERQNSLTSSYFHGTEVVVIVFNLTDRKTFENMEVWLDDTRRSADDQACIIIVGTKADEAGHAVTAEEATAFAQKNNATYFEVSAKTGAGTEELMGAIVHAIDRKSMALSLSTSPPPSSSSSCLCFKCCKT